MKKRPQAERFSLSVLRGVLLGSAAGRETEHYGTLRAGLRLLLLRPPGGAARTQTRRGRRGPRRGQDGAAGPHNCGLTAQRGQNCPETQTQRLQSFTASAYFD